jgi:transposase
MATPTKTRMAQAPLPPPTLSLAFELGPDPWQLGCTSGVAQPPRERTIPAGDITRGQQEIAQAKQRCGLPEDARVVSCYEAGRDGFWLPRCLGAHGVDNHVIDSARIEVKRRPRRAKTDRLDVRKLRTMLRRYLTGAQQVGSVVRGPRVEEEDRRQLHREMLTATQDRTRGSKRLKGL